MNVDRIELYRSGLRRQWRWRYVAHNGKIIAGSSESYHNKEDCINAAVLVCYLGGRDDLALVEKDWDK